jgi:hypothetical protein
LAQDTRNARCYARSERQRQLVVRYTSARLALGASRTARCCACSLRQVLERGLKGVPRCVAGFGCVSRGHLRRSQVDQAVLRCVGVPHRFTRHFHPRRCWRRVWMLIGDRGGGDPVQEVARVGSQEGRPKPQRTRHARRRWDGACEAFYRLRRWPQAAGLFRSGAAATAATGAAMAFVGFEVAMEVFAVRACLRMLAICVMCSCVSARMRSSFRTGAQR